MKPFLLIASAAALLMTSCSEEKFLNISGVEEANNAGKGTIEFQAHQPNQSRANLETFTDNFGVFGIKANLKEMTLTGSSEKYLTLDGCPTLPLSPTSQEDNLVFNNYLVGYIGSYPLLEGGNIETGTAQGSPFSSHWYYEGLGYNEYPTPTSKRESVWKEQYLKYWDANKDYTYFVAYTPYEKTNAPQLKYGVEGKYVFNLECQNEVSIDDPTPFMFAAKQEKNAPHTTSQTPVEMIFHRCQSQIRIAFYEAIKGYKVKMINVKEDAGTNPSYGVTAMPYNAASTVKGSEDNSTKWGSITTKAKPIISFKNPTTTALENLGYDLTLTSQEASTDFVFNFPVKDVYLNSPDPTVGTKTIYLEEERAKKAFSPKVYNVFPESTTDALQFVLSFELEANDTHEIITVNHARVNIPKEYTVWKDNCIYTYVFKITQNTNGSTKPGTDDPTIPEDPDPSQALYPIVFDNLTVTEMTPNGNTAEFTLYDADNNPTATEDAQGMFIFNSNIKKDFAEVGIGQTLNLASSTGTQYMTSEYLTLLKSNSDKFTFTSDDTAVATVGEHSGIVTGVKPGWTTIYVTYTVKDDDDTIIAVYKDALIVYVKSVPTYLKDAVWDFDVNTPSSLESLLKTGTDPSKVTWTINGTSLETANTVFTYNSSNKQITFLKAGEIYLCTAVYTNEGSSHTDYFFVIVKNTFLKTAKEDCVTGTDYILTNYLVDPANSSSVTWTLDTTDLTGTIGNASSDFIYNGTDNKLTFNKAGTYTLEAVYDSKTEYITLNVVSAPEPEPTPGE